MLETDGYVSVETGLPDTGTGALTVLRQVVAETLGIQLCGARVRTLSTLNSPADSGAGGSRVTHVHGRAECKLPTCADVPPLITSLVDSQDGPGPFAAKAIGESSNILTAAAIANAVFDACGVRSMDLPITSEKVFTALRGLLDTPLA